MSHPRVPALPLEIIGNIVDILIDDNDNEQGLQYVKSCSLICQSILPLCRKHIFSSIRIEIGGSFHTDHTDEAFGQLLLETPIIARYIRQLNICIMNPYSESGYFFDQVPRQLTRLQSLAVWGQFPHPFKYSVDWKEISLSMQRSLVNLIHLPTLNHLDLRKIENFLISDLITCTNVKHLSAHEFYITGEQDEATVASSLSQKPMQLQELDITIKDSEALRLLAPRCSDGRPVLDFGCLEKICVYFHWTEAAVPTREIIRKAQQLSDIRLIVADADFRAIEFSKMVTPSLQTLRRVHLVITVNNLSEDPLAGLCEELEEILGKNKLESIDIQIEVQTDEDCATGDEWGKLEKVLLKSGWSMLKHVSLAIIICSRLRGDDGLFEMALNKLRQTQFAGLVSSKNLDFQFSVREEIILDAFDLFYPETIN